MAKAKSSNAVGVIGLGALGFALGWRVRDEVQAGPDGVTVRHTPAFGPPSTLQLSSSNLQAFAVDPSLRSLGADVLWVAVNKTGERIPIAEGESHSGQVREFAAEAAAIAKLPLEPPKFTSA